jgi:DNA gyrase/topoisomerase IV subunit B
MQNDTPQYKSITQIEHILARPELYIANMDRNHHFAKCFDSKTISLKQVEQSPVMEQLFLKVLNNAIENSKKGDLSLIEIEVTPQRITVKNNCMPISFIRNADSIYVPSMVFGELGNGGDNFEIAFVNVYSKKYKVKCGSSGLLFRQKWENNMRVVNHPTISYYEGPDYISISYSLDFDQECIQMYKAHCAFFSYYNKVPIVFNGHKFEVNDLSEYVRLFYPTEYIHYSFSDQYALCFVETPGNSIHLSFVNGMCTEEGGIHMEEFKTKLSERLQISRADLNDKYSLFISCHVNKPTFNSQDRSYFHSYDNGKRSLNIELPGG